MPKSVDIPTCPSVPDILSTGQESREYQIQLVTPMFGGGVEAGQPDQSFPIRPTAIRGQLQFWWRATVGAKYETKEELREAQSDIWGSTERASRVVVRVDDVHSSEPEACAEFENDRQHPDQFRSMPRWKQPFDKTSLPYALFPFQGQLGNRRSRIDINPAGCVHKATFQMKIDCREELWDQVEPAVWAWVNFGGLGARTRRGCGALFCKDFAPHNRDDLATKWKQFMPDSYPVREWPTLADCLLVGKQSPDPIQAWDKVIGLMQRFRQGVEFGRNPGQKPNRPGRSRWPEPETIREVPDSGADRQVSGHQRLTHIPADAFPRAELGLPIVFHFQGCGEPPEHSGLSDWTLYPENDSEGNTLDRMASPLILKSLALSKNNAISIILHLKTLPLTGVNLRQGKTSAEIPSSTVIRDPRLSKSEYINSPLAESENGSAIEAFLKLADNNGFKEMSP